MHICVDLQRTDEGSDDEHTDDEHTNHTYRSYTHPHTQKYTHTDEGSDDEGEEEQGHSDKTKAKMASLLSKELVCAHNYENMTYCI
jgi:hypothetical protein